MATKIEKLQKAWRLYEQEHDHLASSTREVADWAVAQGLIELPEVDPLDILAQNMAQALRAEYREDETGRRYRVNHAVRIMKGGVQCTMWAMMGYAPAEHMERAFTQRREQIIDDCLQLKTDVDVYNNLNNQAPPIQLILNFTDDVAEREIIAERSSKRAA